MRRSSFHGTRQGFMRGWPDVRIHDLRHSFASFLVNAGRSLYEVQKILGHTQVKTTPRYAHLSQETLVDAANWCPIYLEHRQKQVRSMC